MSDTSQNYNRMNEARTNNLSFLRSHFGLSQSELERCLFFRNDDDEPWIPPDILEAIARQAGDFKHINVIHDKYIRERQQVLYIATVVDGLDRTFTRSGAAIIGEAPNGINMDADVLASGRALSAALTGAGFNPFKAGSVVERKEPQQFTGTLNDADKQLHSLSDEAALRNKDLRQIHAIAESKGLITGNDITLYRAELKNEFGVITAAVLNASDRAAVINWITNWEPNMDRPRSQFLAEAAIA